MHLRLLPAVVLDEACWFEEEETGLKPKPVTLAEDGWLEKAGLKHDRSALPRPGNMVLYRCEGALVPAMLTEATGEGCWLARDSRHLHGLIYLTAESIVTRLPQPDLREEAA